MILHKQTFCKSNFTLLEVVIALAVLALSLAGLFSLSGQAQRRVASAQEKWKDQHMLMQAAEYYLLYAEDAPEITPDIFPYGPEYTAKHEYMDAEELPDNSTGLNGQTTLRSILIEVARSRDGKVAGSVRVDRYTDEGSSE